MKTHDFLQMAGCLKRLYWRGFQPFMQLHKIPPPKGGGVAGSQWRAPGAGCKSAAAGVYAATVRRLGVAWYAAINISLMRSEAVCEPSGVNLSRRKNGWMDRC